MVDEIAVSIKDGKLGFIYNEELDFLMDMGPINITRLSNVEFNNKNQLWEVKHKGKVLSSHKIRQEAIEWEIEHFNKRVMEGERFEC